MDREAFEQLTVAENARQRDWADWNDEEAGRLVAEGLERMPIRAVMLGGSVLEFENMAAVPPLPSGLGTCWVETTAHGMDHRELREVPEDPRREQ